MASSFGTLLRRLRLDAGFSQATLAERAGISANAVGAYEQGARSAPRRETIASLARALQLSGETQAEFESAAGRRLARATDEPADNLPWQPTSFVGRSRDIENVTALLAQRRLVTITGAGGIGKTRISIEIASRLSPRPPDGIWFVDLTAAGDAAGVLGKLTSVVGVKNVKRDDVLGALIAEIEGRNMLLVLDNCEHVMEGVRAAAEAILRGCPRVALLATSRERIGIAGERVYQLATLPAGDALSLFAERAAAAKHDFRVCDENVDAAVEICRRLDGIALAIELAAARLPVLGLSELRTQLAKHFGILSGVASPAARQQTLNATISWSYDSLNDVERVLFARLAIFVGGWTLEAAQSVCVGGALEKTNLLDALLSLAEKSLVVADFSSPDAARYSFFESTREYASQRLAAGSDGAGVARAHALWVAGYVDRAYDLFATMPRRLWEDSMTPEFGNALAALDWALAPGGDDEVAGRIASGLRGLWGIGGLVLYGTQYLDAAMERTSAERNPVLSARLLLAQAAFMHPSAMAETMQRAIPLLERAGERRTRAMCYGYLAHALTQDGNYSGASDAYDRASELLHDEGLERTTLHAGVRTGQGMVLFRQGRLDEAKGTLAEALSLSIDIADEWSISICRTNLAEVEFARGNALRAIELVEEALAREVRGTYREHCLLCNLACFKLAIGDVDAAETCAREVLSFARTAHAVVVHVAIAHLAAVAALRGDSKRAARLIGYVDAWCERVRYRRDPTEQTGYDILMESLRGQLPDAEIAALAALGARLTESAAIDELIRP